MESRPDDAKLIFSRYTQLGLLRLLTNPAVMAANTLTIGATWKVYERWLSDPSVEFHPEPSGLDDAFRRVMSAFDFKPAFKWVDENVRPLCDRARLRWSTLKVSRPGTARPASHTK